MNARTSTFYISVIGMIGASVAVVNSILPSNSTALVMTAILTASMALFIALLADVMTANITRAIVTKNLEDQTSLLSAVIGREIYHVLEEEKSKEKK